MNEVIAKGDFLLKVHPLIYATVHAVMLSKEAILCKRTYLCHSTCGYVKQRSSTVQKEELTNAGRHNLHKPTDEKRSIAESLHAYVTRARLTACELRVFLREISQLSKILPPPSLRRYLSSWVYFREKAYSVA